MPTTSISRVLVRWTQPQIGGDNRERDDGNGGESNEGSRVELESDCEAGSRQTTIAFLSVGLMCEHARRGLSN